MNKTNTSLILIIITSLLLTSITTFTPDDDTPSCSIHEISQTHGLKLDITTSSKHCLFLNINSLSKNGDGVLTFRIPKQVKHNITSFHSSPIYNIVSPDRTVFYPTESSQSKFPLEQSYESWYDPNLQDVYHLYFKREMVLYPTSKDFLLIYIEHTFTLSDKDYSNDNIIHILPLVILDKAFSNNLSQKVSNDADFSLLTTIPDYNPYYAVLTFSGEYINNYLITSQSGYFTYTCDDLIIKSDVDSAWVINQNRHSAFFTDIYSLNQEGRYCKRFILKYITSDKNTSSKQFTVTHLSVPFKSIQIPSHPHYKLQSSHHLIEINNYEDHYRLFNYLGGNYNDGDEYYITMRTYYGSAMLSYFSDTVCSRVNKPINETNSINKSKHVEHDIISLHKYQYNILYLKCNERCLVDIEIFKAFNLGTMRDKQMIIDSYGDYYIVFETINENPVLILFPDLGSFTTTFELIGNDYDLTEIEGSFNHKSFKLNEQKTTFNTNVYEYDEFDMGLVSGEVMVITKGRSDCVLKISVQGINYRKLHYININTHQDIIPNSFELYDYAFAFQLPKNTNINTFQIQILLKDENNKQLTSLIQFTSLFHKSNNKNIMIPSIRNHNINILTHPSYKYIFEISNPYLFNKDIDSDTFYYLIVDFFHLSQTKLFFAFTGIITPNYPLLKANKLNVIQQTYQSETHRSFLLERGGKVRDSKFIIEFFQCKHQPSINPSFYVKDYFNKTIWESNLNAKIVRNTIMDIGVDYTLHMEVQDSKVLMFYTYIPAYLESELTGQHEFSKREIIYNETKDERILNIRPFIIGGVNVTYKVYLTEVNEVDADLKDLCSFIESEPYVIEVASDVNGEDVNIKLDNVKGGKYVVDVVAEKMEPFPSFWIYQRLEIDVSYVFGKKEVMGTLCKWIGGVMMVAIGFVVLVKKRFFNYKSNDNKIHSKEMNNYS